MDHPTFSEELPTRLATQCSGSSQTTMSRESLVNYLSGIKSDHIDATRDRVLIESGATELENPPCPAELAQDSRFLQWLEDPGSEFIVIQEEEGRDWKSLAGYLTRFTRRPSSYIDTVDNIFKSNLFRLRDLLTMQHNQTLLTYVAAKLVQSYNSIEVIKGLTEPERDEQYKLELLFQQLVNELDEGTRIYIIIYDSDGYQYQQELQNFILSLRKIQDDLEKKIKAEGLCLYFKVMFAGPGAGFATRVADLGTEDVILLKPTSGP
ncbi:hypothetical protein BDV96DRAFT_678211 [Lophiotrema nucula]|uniref:Uncharacterized protein n=1 Tax=Lophiotrema nucula TaxID=690887 RepID=A0A6A5YEN5_9PLEO|nr:hypothetical protein BDV96DRAFT_678211 [Lophiotrema nucula]